MRIPDAPVFEAVRSAMYATTVLQSLYQALVGVGVDPEVYPAVYDGGAS